MLISLCFLSLIWAADAVPKPVASWQVAFSPDFALVQDQGDSVFFEGADGYLYARDGLLQEHFTLAHPVDALYRAANDQTLVLSGGVLASLSASGTYLWQKPLPAAILDPLVFGNDLIYATDTQVLVLDPSDGATRFSLSLGKPIQSTQVIGDQIWISDASGESLIWEPAAQKQVTRMMGQGDFVKFLKLSPRNELVALYDGGRLVVQRPNQKTSWTRALHIDFATPIEILKGKDSTQFLVATMGRNLFVFNGAHGQQLQRLRLGSRPIGLVGFGETQALLLADQSDELVWYQSLKGTFVNQKITDTLSSFSVSPHYLLLVDAKGIIMLFKRESSNS